MNKSGIMLMIILYKKHGDEIQTALITGHIMLLLSHSLVGMTMYNAANNVTLCQ